MAERGVLVKDRTEMVIVVTDRTGLWDSVREILFKGASVNLFEASVQESYKTRIIRGSTKRTSFPNKVYFKTGKNSTLLKKRNREKLEKGVDCLGDVIDEEKCFNKYYEIYTKSYNI